MQTVRPREGSPVVGVVNRKDDFGRIALSNALPGMTSLYSSLRSSGIEFEMVGSALYGTRLSVPRSFEEERTVSLIVDVFFKGSNSNLKATVKREGWAQIDAKQFFSITFIDDEGMPRIAPSALRQMMFVSDRSDFALSVVQVPSEFYAARSGAVRVIPFSRVPRPADTVVFKLLRGNQQDQVDLTNLAVAENNFASLLGSHGEKMDKKMHEKAKKSGWIDSFEKKVSRLIENVMLKSKETETGLHINTNLDVLGSIHESAVRLSEYIKNKEH